MRVAADTHVGYVALYNSRRSSKYRKRLGDFEIWIGQTANNLQRHDTTFMQLARVHALTKNFEKAIEVYLEALEFSPENPELLTADAATTPGGRRRA